MRRAAKVDRNHVEICEALRKAGASVLSMAPLGNGAPDVLCGYAGQTILLELKDGSLPPSARRLTDDQLKWHSGWKGGPLAVVCDVESALRVLGVMCPPTRQED